MRLFASIRNLFSRFSRRDAQLYRIPWLPVGESFVTRETALTISAVYACIRVIASSIASCEVRTFEPRGKSRVYFDDSHNSTGVGYLLNVAPNDEMTAIAFSECMFWRCLGDSGNAYAQIVRDRAQRVKELWPIDTQDVTPEYVQGRLIYRVQSDAGSKILLPHEVLHLRGPSMRALVGDSVIGRAVRGLALILAREKFGLDFYSHGAHLDGIFESPFILGQKKKELLESYMLDHAGKRTPLVLENGLKFQPVSVTPKDASLIEDKKFSVEEVCRWFGVPTHKIMHNTGSYNSNELSSIEFERDSLRPWAIRYSQEITLKLLSGTWRRAEIDLEPLTYGDMNSRASAASTLVHAGIMTRNEARAKFALDDAGPAADVLTMQGANIPITEVKDDDERQTQ